jgi:hypothetical protein
LHNKKAMERKKLMLVVGGIAAVGAIYLGYRYFIKPKAVAGPGTGTTTSSANQSTTTSLGSVVSPAGPPPGYQGPMGGPYTWAGAGAPPDGKYTV